MKPPLLPIVSLYVVLSAGTARADWEPGAGGSGQAGGGQAAWSAPPRADGDTRGPSSTERELEEADREDSGRGLEFVWLEGEVGYQHVSLEGLSTENLLPETVRREGGGLVYGAGVGVRVIFITLGARFRLGQFQHWDLWTLNGELGIRVPLGSWEPHFELGGGYASLGLFDGSSSALIDPGALAKSVDVTGYNIRAGGGLDYYVWPVFSVGLGASAEVMGLARPGVDPRTIGSVNANATAGDTPDEQRAALEAEAYKADGASLGYALTGTFVLGLHF